MQVGELMTRDVQTCSPTQTIQQAARIMAEIDAGFLPVGEGDRLVGMLTDRDIAVRAVAQGRGPDTLVRDCMTLDVKYCYDDDDIADVVRNMAAIQVRRLPVVNNHKRLIGVVSISDLAKAADPTLTGRALGTITQPGGAHTQGGHVRH